MKDKFLFSILCVILLLVTGCASPSPMPTSTSIPTITSAPTSTSIPTSTPVPTPTLTPLVVTTDESSLTAAERLELFNLVWQTINDKYFDPTFGGKDWKAIGDRYRQMLSTIEDDRAFWREVLNPMLFELGVSHLAALPAEYTRDLDRMTFATGSLGFDIRLLEGKAVVTRVDKDSPADYAGLRPGFVIVSLDGWTLGDLAAESLRTPPNNERNRRANTIQNMRALLFDEKGKGVTIEYLDGSDQPGSVDLQFATRSGSACAPFGSGMPPACAEIDVQRLSDGIGYIRFSGFLDAALDGVLQAIGDMHDLPGLIIDLRGNPGGVFPVRKAIASQLVGEPKLFMRYQHRDGLEETYLDAVADPYPGLVVLLVDELSASSSEEFSGSLQALGRATIVGSQTPGRCLTAEIFPLPGGGLLIYPNGQSQTPDGRILEDNGVIPDIVVSLDRDQLLQGSDAQLQAAIDYLAKWNKK